MFTAWLRKLFVWIALAVVVVVYYSQQAAVVPAQYFLVAIGILIIGVGARLLLEQRVRPKMQEGSVLLKFASLAIDACIVSALMVAYLVMKY